MEIAKTYQPKEIEDKWYAYWMKNGYFKADAKSTKPKYSIVIPPPNVTGVLHMGHMLNNTIQDVLIRKARMSGFEACWVPGTDHASIATEAKVVAMLKEKGITKKDIGREKFLEHAWEWKEKYGGIILEQLKKLGASCDWDRTRFTMEPALSEAVIDVFIDLHKKGMIYRGKRMVNWDPQSMTTLSDEELITKDSQLKLYFINYAIAGEDNTFLTIATSRPETIMADSAICIHPEDERYRHLHGKKAIIPLIDREIPIILDEYVDREFGTGCLKVTPAHDKNDYELGLKHHLAFIDIFNDNGTLNEQAKIYVGADRFEARKKIAIELEEKNHLVKVQEYPSQLNTSERTGAVVEPKLSLQWFVDMQKFMQKNPEVLDCVLNDEVKFYPSKYKNVYKHWLENIKDWNISRQLWWGQQIPAWYLPYEYFNKDQSSFYVIAKDKNEAIEKMAERLKNIEKEISSELPSELMLSKPKINGQENFIDNQGNIIIENIAEHIYQDPDVLDTWFSSWLWPISVFDGFENPGNDDIKAFYPTKDLVTGPDIIFFWVARMIMAGYEYKHEKPFETVYFTGIVRDKQRRKMSKSLGNSPDPLDLVNQYGADAVRMGILLSSPAGNDILFDESLMEQGRNFCNKIWNAYRLVSSLEIVDDEKVSKEIVEANLLAKNWMQNRINTCLEENAEKLKEYKLSETLMAIYKLIWDDFCAWYLEMIKPVYGQPINQSTMEDCKNIFADLLKMLHPFMPFITEEIYHVLHEGNPEKPIIVSEFPVQKNAVKEATDLAIETITQIRNIRNSKGLSPKIEFEISIQLADESNKNVYLKHESMIRKLANTSAINFVKNAPESAVQSLVNTDTLYIHLEERIDAETEIQKANEEIVYLEGFLKSVNAKLSNEKFVANAKPEVIEKERQKKADAETKLESLKNSVNSFKSLN